MKKLMLSLLFVLVLCTTVWAEFTVNMPMETSMTAFWFPSDGVFAMGASHTFLRITHSSLPQINFDMDVTIAQEVNQDMDTLGGIGAKIGYKPKDDVKSGLSFEPSLGITFMNNFVKFKKFDEIVANYKFAVYGTILLYRW